MPLAEPVTSMIQASVREVFDEAWRNRRPMKPKSTNELREELARLEAIVREAPERARALRIDAATASDTLRWALGEMAILRPSELVHTCRDREPRRDAAVGR